VRFNNFHPSIVVAKCDTPQKWRWGKAPRTYRGLRKIWIADDLTRKSRTQINPAEVVQTAIPWLGLKAALPVVDDGGADAAVDGGGATGKKGGGCGCQFPGRTRGGAWLGGLGLAWVVWRRPRRRRILRLRSR
jgi:hypothetical protein